MSNKPQATILVVDDEPINLRILAEGLSEHYRVLLADNGKKALEIAQNQSPDLILLDIYIPEMDGYEICTALKNNALTRAIPVIFITADESDESELKGLKLGAADYFHKPFKFPLMLARIAIQIELKRKTDLLESLVDIDGLTGIANRRKFDSQIHEEWRRCKRNEFSLTLCLMDVDYFKQFNDNYGHAEGDNTLKEVAQLLNKNVCRGGDLVARYGGEEFIMLLPGVSLEDGEKLVEKLKMRIDELAIPHAYSGCAGKITLSFGIASVVPRSGLTDGALLKAADEQLYLAKSRGRNQVASIDLNADLISRAKQQPL